MTKLNWQIVDRYFAGEATAAERALVEQWLSHSARFRALVEEVYRGVLDDKAIRQAAADVRARLERDLALTPEPARAAAFVQSRASRRRWATALKAAAAVAALLGGALIYQQSAVTSGQTSTGEALRIVSAPRGRSVPLALPDGSQIVLSPGSSVRYLPAAFAPIGQRRREVRLEGQAYFAVRHDAAHPFLVRAGDLVAEDLGTEFVVRAYPEDLRGRVVVRQGLVGLAGSVIAPGQGGRLNADGTALVEPADTASWFAWTSGRLVFARMPLRDALPTLSRWYDVQFQLSDATLGAIELAGQFPAQFSDDALAALELALGLKASRNGRVMTFHAAEPAGK